MVKVKECGGQNRYGCSTASCYTSEQGELLYGSPDSLMR